MRIVVVYQYFLPEGRGGASRWNDLSYYLTKMGHEVTVVAGTVDHLSGRPYELERFHLWSKSLVRQVRVLRFFTVPEYGRKTWARILSFSSFMTSSLASALFARRPEIVIATSPPLTVGLSGYVLSRIWRCPFILDVRDLWPQAAVDLGTLRNRAIIHLARRLERFLYRKAHLVCMVSPAAKNLVVNSGIPSEKVMCIPNGVSLERFKKRTDRDDVRRALSWGGKCVVLYIGSHGAAHRLDHLLEAAKQLAEEKEILFVLVGDGVEKDRLRRVAAEMGLSNVTFLPAVPVNETPALCYAADVGLALFPRTPAFLATYPQKLFDYMAAGLPIVLSVDGVSRELVEGSGVGLYCDPEDSRALAQAVVRLCRAPQLREAMGQRGRELVAANFAREVQAREYEGRLRAVAKAFHSGRARTDVTLENLASH